MSKNYLFLENGDLYNYSNNQTYGPADVNDIGTSFKRNLIQVAANVTIYSYQNAVATGPLIINNGVTLTIEDGARAAIV